MKKIFCMLLTIILLMSGCSVKGTEWVLNINNKKVSKAEFLVYLQEQRRSFEAQGGQDIWEIDFDGVSAWEVAKQNAANSVTIVKLALEHAKSLGVDTNVSPQQVKEQADELYNSFTQQEIQEMGITKEMINEIIKEGNIQSMVYNAITQNYQPNPEQVEQYCQSYYKENIDMYKNVSLEAIIIDKTVENSLDKINTAYTLLQQGKDFKQVQQEYSLAENKNMFMLSADMYNKDITNRLYALNEGEITPALEYENSYYIFKADVVDTISYESVKDDLAEEYTENKKLEIYQEQNNHWNAEAEIVKNAEVWDSIIR